jgi:transposase
MGAVKGRKPGKRPPKSIDPSEAATILAFGDLHTDDEAAKKFGVSKRTIERWRAAARAGAKPELAALVAERKKAALEKHAGLLDEFFAEALEAGRAKLKNAKENTLRSIVGAIKIAGELRIQRDLLRDDGDDPELHQPSSGAAEAKPGAARGAPASSSGTAADPAGPRVH